MRRITGPSGQAALFVTCADAGECYEIAGRNCPTGYDLRPSRVGEHSVVVTCLRPAASSPAFAQPALASSQVPTPNDYFANSNTAAMPEPAPTASGPWQPNRLPPPPPPPAPRDQASGMVAPHPIGADGPDLGY